MSASPSPGLVLPDLLQGNWTAVLICTYSADLTFLETRLLSQLAQIPLRIVLADQKQLRRSFDEAARTGQRRRHANKAYVAAPVRHPRSAHAKLIVLLGPTSGLLVVGSGNLGYEGYAAPGELWSVYAYSDDRPNHVNEFAAARAYIDDLETRGLLDPPVGELVQSAWDQATWLPRVPEGRTAVLSNISLPIHDRLREVVTDPVDEVVAHAPFHDVECAALRALIDEFAPETVRLLVTSATSASPGAIARVLADAKRATVEKVQVKSEPAAYIHAKWVHLIHGERETLLTGSANLSGSALLCSADKGNLEMGVLATGTRGAFDHLYRHLEITAVEHIDALDISYRGEIDVESEPSEHAIVLWSRLDRTCLTLVFDREVHSDTEVGLTDHAGRVLLVREVAYRGECLRVELAQESVDRVSEGGKVQVALNGRSDRVSVTWPYQMAHLLGRLDREAQRDYLQRLGDLPEQDAELAELLEELEQTLIIDRASAWRIAKPESPLPQSHVGEDSRFIELHELDWERVRRDPRYRAYLAQGRSAGQPPTEIQVILAAITGRLGEIGMSTPGRDDNDDEVSLAREGDAASSDPEAAEEAEQKQVDELARRRLSIGTRTRMAFDRFVRRYAAALDDLAFVEQLGPIPAAKNAAVFNHLLTQLLQKDFASSDVTAEAQLRTWRFLWGDGHRQGMAAHLDEATAEVVRQILSDVGVRTTTLRGVVASLSKVEEKAIASSRSDIVRHLLVDSEFGLTADQLVDSAGGTSEADMMLNALIEAASPASDAEILDIVLAPYDIDRSSAGWKGEEVVRQGKGIQQRDVFELYARVADLTPRLAQEMLAKVAVAVLFSGRDPTYARIGFLGNERAVAFWDEDVRSGVVWDGVEVHHFESISPPWPDWFRRSGQLKDDLAIRAVEAA